MPTKFEKTNGIRDILVKEGDIKLNLFADDMTCFLRDMTSYYRGDSAAFFSKFSNLEVNNDKTEIFAIGRHFLDQPGAIIGDGDRKRALFLVLGLAP